MINDDKFKRRKRKKGGTFRKKGVPQGGIFGPGSKFKALKDAYQRYEGVAELQHKLLTN